MMPTPPSVSRALCGAFVLLLSLAACATSSAPDPVDTPRAAAHVAQPATHATDHIEPLSMHRPMPIVIAHRGASGHRPEHTLEAYALAIRQGADFIEPDLVPTRDGVLIARHENELSGTTDVADRPEFAERRTTKRIDGERVTGWFSEDFTLAEIKTLRARERIPAVRPGNTAYDGRFEVPTLVEILDLVRRESRDGRQVGIYPETKHPTYFAREGRHIDGTPIARSLGRLLVETLVAEGFTDPERVRIQSFEIENLLELRREIMPRAGVRFPLVQLFGRLGADAPYDVIHHAAAGTPPQTVYGDFVAAVDGGLGAGTRYRALSAPAALAWMRAAYADGIGPSKADVLDERPPGLIAAARGAGLSVHVYTLRAERVFLARGQRNAEDEAVRLFTLGADGIFADQPELALAARARFLDQAGEGGDARPTEDGSD